MIWVIDYDGRTFRPQPRPGTESPLARYHQAGDLVWAEFEGGEVRRGSLTGLSSPDGKLELAYTMVLTDGEVIAGQCSSVPEVLPDGRIRLSESWQRYGAHAASGTSFIEEVRL